MDPALVKLILIGGIVLIVLSIGLRARPRDALLLVRNPALGARAMVAMFVLVPAFVLLMTWALPFDRPVRAALLALAIAPMPPLLPNKEIKVGGGADYAIGLQVLATVVSILLMPVMLWLIGKVYGDVLTFDPVRIGTTLLITVGAPLAGGMLLGHLLEGRRDRPVLEGRRDRLVLEGRRDRLAALSGKLGMAALAVGALIILYVAGPVMGALIGGGVLWAAAAMILFGLLVGHWLGGPDAGNRGALAVACAARHPGVAIALAATAFPVDTKAIIGAVLLYLIANAVLTIPYMKWRGQRTA